MLERAQSHGSNFGRNRRNQVLKTGRPEAFESKETSCFRKCGFNPLPDAIYHLSDCFGPRFVAISSWLGLQIVIIDFPQFHCKVFIDILFVSKYSQPFSTQGQRVLLNELPQRLSFVAGHRRQRPRHRHSLQRAHQVQFHAKDELFFTGAISDVSISGLNLDSPVAAGSMFVDKDSGAKTFVDVGAGAGDVGKLDGLSIDKSLVAMVGASTGDEVASEKLNEPSSSYSATFVATPRENVRKERAESRGQFTVLSALGVELSNLSNDDTGEKLSIGKSGIEAVWATTKGPMSGDDMLKTFTDQNVHRDKKCFSIGLKDVKLFPRFHQPLPRLFLKLLFQTKDTSWIPLCLLPPYIRSLLLICLTSTTRSTCWLKGNNTLANISI